MSPESPSRRNGRASRSTFDDVVHNDLGADVLGLGLHLLHQPGALDDIGEARIVLDVGRDGELAAGLDALDQHGLQHGAGRIDGGGIAGRARAQESVHARVWLCS